MNYLEFSFQLKPFQPYSDILVAELADIGFESFTEEDELIKAYIQESLFDKQKFSELPLFSDASCVIEHSNVLIPSQNWNKTWESNFEPIHVGNRCVVRAPFHEKVEGIQYDIVIEPKMSFGTGHHETTALIIEEMLGLELNGKSLLDMGCGTSVLAILAAKMGANPIVAIDNDEWAYTNSVENVERNAVHHILVQKGDASLIKNRMFDIILANINKNILLQDMHTYVQALNKNGKLFISGFFVTDVDELSQKANSLGLNLIKVRSKNNWTMLGFSLNV